MFITDDPLLDFWRHDREQAKRLERLPVCVGCSEPIQDERLWDINGFLFCDDCAKDRFQADTEDYIE